MSTHPSDFILQKFGGIDAIKKQAETARVWLAKTVLAQIAEGDSLAIAKLTPSELSQVQQALQIVELRALDLMQDWRRDFLSKEGQEFRQFCSLAFDLRRSLPKPENADDTLKSNLLLSCVAVLGDRSADIRRHFREHPWVIPHPQSKNWGQRLFYTTADAFLRVVRKQKWTDLEEVATAIKNLREQQKDFESGYLDKENGVRQTAALELVAFYHLAKSIEVLGLYVGTGEPATATDEVEFHVSRAIRATDSAGIIELALLLRWIGAASRMMIRTTIWHQLAAYNDKMTVFKKSLASRDRTQPMFDLLPPQRDAIQELMSIGNRALVVEMPTSGGKTLLAEFRIIQTKVNVADSWIAYLVPTRALVNQVTARLRRDLGSLDLKVELASPAIEIDVFEDELLKGKDAFDVLVTTPEKLDLLIRSQRIDLKQRTLGLVILDEAHNLGDGERGLKSELLLATINRESPDTHFLLLTPFVPNSEELAKWLDDERSKSIKPSFSVDWQPNDRLIGLTYIEGKGKTWGIKLRALHTNRPSIHFEDEAVLEPNKERSIPISQTKTSKKKVAAEIARVLSVRDCSVVLAFSPADTWDIAQYIAEQQPSLSQRSQNLELVRRHVEDEYGEDFPLAGFLEKGIGVHHAGISPDTRYLLEWLIEKGELKTLVATSTPAQGVNFPISSVVLATHHKSKKVGSGYIKEPLRPDEFWNIAGRAGRLFQDTLGLVLFASTTTQDKDIEVFVDQNVQHLASALEEMIADTMEKGWELDLKKLVKNDLKWSSFVQFLSHTYRLINDHSRFIADTEMLLKRTYAYRRLLTNQPEVAEQLLESTRAYADQLKNLPAGVASLVDTTGFSPETVVDLLMKRKEIQLSPSEWSPSQLFRIGGEGLKNVVGKMLEVGELNIEGRGPGEPGTIAEIISMWVGGKSLKEIALKHFPTESNDEKKITECCRLIFQKLAQNASWGLGAIQSLSGVDIESLSSEQQEAFRTLPAMIYYGCNSVEGVLMRSLSVPRSICVPIGEAYKAETPVDYTEVTRIGKARHWLKDAELQVWNTAAKSKKMSGQDYRNLWLILNGREPVF
ncbi:MAG: DEAD/DEAH box helicase [Candidatus Brocadia sp.]|nr:DEAD/DEAH box helicase [Candidatus Brocadia sp.]